MLTAVLSTAQVSIFNTVEEANNYFRTTLPEDLTQITYFEDEDPEMYNFFINRTPGEIIVTGTQAYKVQGFKNTSVQQCSMINLDPTLPGPEIERLEKLILKKYNEGVSFEKLLQQYSTDKNPYMLENKITLDDANSEYATAFTEHPNYKIYVVNIPSHSYRIVLKNGSAMTKKAISVFSPNK